jgi:hypothetical protein
MEARERLPAKAEIFLFRCRIQTVSGVHPASSADLKLYIAIDKVQDWTV